MKTKLFQTDLFDELRFRQWNKVCAVSILIMLLAAGLSNAAIITTTGSGNWSSTVPNAPWPGGIIPATTDDIIVGTGFTLTVDGNRTCNSMRVGNGSTVSVNATFILTVTTTLIFPNAAAASTTGAITGSGTINSGAMTVGNTAAPSVASGTNTVTVTSTISALNTTGALTLTSQRLSGTRINNPIFRLQSGTVTTNGTLTCVTTSNATSTTLVDLTTGAQTGTLILANSAPITTSGNSGVSTFSFNGTSATVNYSGAAQTALVTTYRNLTLSGTGVKTFATTPTVNGVLSLEGTTASIAVTTGVVTYGANATLQYNKTAVGFSASTEEWISPFVATGGVIIANTCVITSPGALQMGNATSVPLTIQSGASLTAAGLITLHGNFINAGTFTSATGITLGSNLAQSIDGFTTSGNVTMSKTGGTATLQGPVNGGGLTINGAGGTLNLGAGLTHTFTGAWTRTAGTLNGGSSILRIGGSVSGAGGTFTANAGTVEWNGGAQTVAGVTYNNLTLSGSGVKTLTGVTSIGGNFETGGTASATAAAALTIGGSVILGSGTTFTAGAFTHNVAGNWTNNGATFTNTGSTVDLNGGTQIIGGSSSTNFNDLILSGPGTKTFSVATVTNAKLIILTGVVADLSTLNHFANSLRIDGVGQPVGTSGSTSSPAVNTNDIFFAATSGFITVLSAVPSEIYYSRATGNWNSTTTWSTVSFASAINLGGFPAAGDIVNIGGGNFTVTVNAASVCASIMYESDAGNSPSVLVNNGISLDVSGPIDIPRAAFGDVNTLAVGGGILNAGGISFTDAGLALGGLGQRHALTISTGTATISGDVVTSGATFVGSATITFTNNGLLRVGGAFLDSSNGNLTPSIGTVEYNGAAQTIGDFTYNNLTISGSGVKTVAGPLDINGSFTLGSGTTFTAGPYTHTLEGDWINNGTTFNYAGNTISLDGGAQSIGGTNATNFNNLTLAGSSTKTFAYQTIIDGMLSINGVLANLGSITTHQARALALNGSGQVSGTWGSVASAAINKDNTYFTPGTTGEVIITNRVYFSRQSGNWTNNATWSTITYGNGTNLGAFPVAGDIVNIGSVNPLVITVDANAACASLSYQSNTNFNPTVSISSTNTLDVLGAIEIPAAAGTFFGTKYTNTLAVAAGTLNAGSISFSDGGNFGNHVLSISSGLVTVTGDVTQGGAANADITFGGAGFLRLRGAFLNSGNCDFTASTGTVEYSSTTEAQSIGNFTYYNLTLNNTFSSTGQLSLVGNTTVSNILTMTSGRVNLNGNTMTLTRSVSGALVHDFSSATGWMYGGSINRAFPAGSISMGVSPSVDGMLPIGTAANFRPFYFGKTSVASSGGTITLSHSDPGTTTSGLTIDDGGSTIILRNNSAWVSSRTGGGAAVFRIRYGGTGLGTVTNLGHLRAMLFGSTIQQHIGASGSFTEPYVERNLLTAAELSNTFYMGSVDNSSPLPIELLHFTARINNDVVELTWSTASEIDNDFFTIERASNIEEFETVGDLIDGKGTSYEKSDYFTRDENPIYGRSYYRLKQTDYDGKFTYSDLQVINYEGPRFSSLQVYPNPSDGNTLTILVTGLKEQTSVPVQIYNIQGQKVYESILEVRTPGTLKYDVEFGSPLKQGLYIIKAGQTLQLTRKLIVD